jgi:hypothetical protein
MHRTAFTLLLLTAACASAQTSQSCPINLFAQRQSSPTLLSAGEAQTSGPGQGLHVTLTRTGTPAVASIEAVLHGISPDPRLLPVGKASPGDITRTFQLQRKAGEASLTSFDLWMSRVGALRWVDVTAVTYADGTTWHTPQASLCRATPSLLVMVASR